MQITVNIHEPFLRSKIVELSKQYLPLFQIGETTSHFKSSYTKKINLVFDCPEKLKETDCNIVSDDETTKYIMVSRDSSASIDCIKKGYFDYFLEDKLEEEFKQLKNRLKLDLASSGSNPDKAYLIIKDYRSLKKIYFSEILFIEAYGSYSNIHTNEKFYTVSKTIKAITKDFPDFFVRVHRSYAVNLSYVLSFSHEEVTMKNSTKIRISRAKKMALVEAIDIHA
jgi:DNA-binding LytR/AlgR family response regulator